MSKFDLFSSKTIKVLVPKKPKVKKTKSKYNYYMLCFSGSNFSLSNLTIPGHRIVRKYLDHDKHNNAIVCVNLDKQHGLLEIGQQVIVQIPQTGYPGRPFMRTYFISELDENLATMRESR